MNTVFADAFYFVARLNKRDQHHGRVVAFARGCSAALVTTDWVLLEVADALAESACRSRVRDFIMALRVAPGHEVVAADAGLLLRALEFYHQHADKGWTLTDCTSFIVMRERGLVEALTGDHHFAQAGFIPLLRQQ